MENCIKWYHLAAGNRLKYMNFWLFLVYTAYDIHYV